MTDENHFFALFDGLDRQGPGSIASTLKALASLPPLPHYGLIADIGCGCGASTLPLAEATVCQIKAFDLHKPFIDQLEKELRHRNLLERVTPVIADMSKLPLEQASVDLLWSEGAIYIIGFDHGLSQWKRFLTPNGYVAITELSWLNSSPSEKAKSFWTHEYPGIRSITENIVALEKGGFELVTSFPLPSNEFYDGYYEVLEQRAQAMKSNRPNDQVALNVADTILKEIDVWQECKGDFSYVFYVAQLR
jgi:ubiquinone/menaquinone biosynthesis C-methylase UbiE